MSTKAERDRIELLQGTLDLLILRTLRLGRTHGHAIAKAIERGSDDVLQVEQGSLYPALQSRWGPSSIRRFINALNVPRVDKTYDAVFDLTPPEFDAAFRQYAERRFRPVVR